MGFNSHSVHFASQRNHHATASVTVAGMIPVYDDSVLATKWTLLEESGYGGEVRMRERSVVWMRKDDRCSR
jgi:hypothetical protein